MNKRRVRINIYLHVFCSISKQPSKCDGIGDCAQIDEHDGRKRLDVQCIIEVTSKKWQFPLDVQDKTSTKPSRQSQVSQKENTF